MSITVIATTTTKSISDMYSAVDPKCPPENATLHWQSSLCPTRDFPKIFREVSARFRFMLAYCICACGLFMAIGRADAASIGINFFGGSGNSAANGAAVTGAAGAPGFVQSNWNNVAIPPNGQTGTATNLIDDLGLTTSTGVTWAATGTYDTGIPLTTQDDNLMKGFLDVFGATPGTVTVSGIPFSSYEVVVYFDGANLGENQVMSFAIGGQTIFGLDAANTNFSGTYIQVPNSSVSDLGINTPAGNFLEFNTVTGNSFTLTATAGSTTGGNSRARINGLEILATPEPAAAILAFMGIVAFLVCRRARVVCG